MIDGALAFTGNGVILGFKAGTTTQHFEIAWAPSLSGTFHLVGRPDIVLYNDTVENYEFVTVDGRVAPRGDVEHARPTLHLHAGPG